MASAYSVVSFHAAPRPQDAAALCRPCGAGAEERRPFPGAYAPGYSLPPLRGSADTAFLITPKFTFCTFSNG